MTRIDANMKPKERRFNNRRDSDRLGKAVSRWDGTNSQKATPNAFASRRRKRRFLWSVDLNLRSLRYLLFKVRPEPLRHLPLATCLVLAMLRPSMFAPSITRRPRVPVQ